MIIGLPSCPLLQGTLLVVYEIVCPTLLESRRDGCNLNLKSKRKVYIFLDRYKHSLSHILVNPLVYFNWPIRLLDAIQTKDLFHRRYTIIMILLGYLLILDKWNLIGK